MAIIVNGVRIEDEAIREEAERMRPAYEKAFADEAPPTREARLREWARDNAIERVLLEQAAGTDSEPLPPEEVEKALEAAMQNADESQTEEKLRADVERHLRVNRLMENVVEDLPEPADEAVRRYYEEHQKEFMAPERIHAAHLVKNVSAAVPPEVAEAELRKARQELADGADFAETAVKYSDCPENGGDLGWFPRGQMVEEFEHTVWKMKPGDVSDIFATRFGFHLVRLIERKAAAPYALEEVADPIRQHLAARMREEAIETYLDGLRQEATIEEA